MAAEVVCGVVLGVQPYGERGIVVQLYTREYGRMGVISYAGKAKDGSNATSYFRVLSILKVGVREGRHARNMRQLVGVEGWKRGTQAALDVPRMAVACFIGEMLQSLLTEPTQNEEIYEFLEVRIELLYAKVIDEIPFLMVFVLDLSKVLGYEPAGASTAATPHFNLGSGEFCSQYDANAIDSIARDDAAVWSRLLTERYRVDLRNVHSAQRYRVLQQELRYLEIHSGVQLKLKSFSVLRELVG